MNVNESELARGIVNRSLEIGRQRGRIRIASARQSNGRIVELEKALGLPPGPSIWNVFRANQRIVELEQMLAEKVATPPVPVAVPAPAAKPQLHGLARAVAATRIEHSKQPAQAHSNLTGRARQVAATKREFQK